MSNNVISMETFLARVQEIIDSRPTYRTGGSGTDGTCDCIGLIIGAMVRAGHKKYDMHSSNYFARYQMRELQPLSSAGDCYRGMVVYKRYASGNANYSLNDRYKAGGRYHTGDLLDYYHVGVVLSASPLRIAHCTKYTYNGVTVDGIEVDTKLGKWECGGRLDGVDYENINIKIEVGKVAGLTGKTCKVISGNLNLRLKKDSDSTRICLIQDGANVLCVADEGTWSKIYYDGACASTKKKGPYTGYGMTQYLQEVDIDAPEVDQDAQGDASGASGEITNIDRIRALEIAVFGVVKG